MDGGGRVRRCGGRRVAARTARRLRTVGACCGPVCASALAAVADALEQGVPWGDAWSVAGAFVDEPGTRGLGAVLHTLDDALRSPWQDGSAAVPRLRAAAEQLDTLERMHIERAASTLSVRLLLPMGLCFLPAFLCIAVVPTIMSWCRRLCRLCRAEGMWITDRPTT